MEQPPGRPAAQTTWATHPFVGLVSSVVVLASLLAVAATEWRKWDIGLLVWGLGVAVAAGLYPLVTEKWALHRFLSAEEAAKRRLHKRQQLSGVNMAIIAVGVAVVASGTGSIAVDAVFTGFFVVVAGGSFLAGAYMARKTEARGRA